MDFLVGYKYKQTVAFLFFYPGFIICNKDRLLLLACQTDNFYLKIDNNYELCTYCLLFFCIKKTPALPFGRRESLNKL